VRAFVGALAGALMTVYRTLDFIEAGMSPS